jgi:hypothetical protein
MYSRRWVHAPYKRFTLTLKTGLQPQLRLSESICRTFDPHFWQPN